MKITITIESDRPFNGNEVTRDQYEQWLWNRKHQRYSEEKYEEPNADWLVRLGHLPPMVTSIE